MRAAAKYTAKLNVFISYSRQDLSFAQSLVAALEARGLECKIDTRDLPALEDWRRELIGFIRAADAVVFVVSPNSITSKVCAWEIEQVGLLGKRLAPVVLQRVPDYSIPAAIAAINFVFLDTSDAFEAGIDKLAVALQTDLGWIKEHTRIGELARRWDERGRTRGLNISGSELEDAERWIATRPREAPEPTALHRDLILASRQGARRRIRNWLAGTAAIAATGFALAAVALVQREVARSNAALAIEQTREARQSQSLFQARQSRQALERGDASAAAQIAIEALPDTTGTSNRRDWPYVVQVEQALYAAWHQLRERAAIIHSSGVHAAAISPDGALIASGTAAGGIRLASPDGKTIADISGHKGWVRSLAFTTDGRHLVSASSDATARVWTRDGALVAVLAGHTLGLHTAQFSPTSDRIVTASEDGTARLWQMDGKPLAELAGHTESVNVAHFSPDGTLVATASADTTVRLWTRDGLPLATLSGHTRPVFDVRFSPDSQRLVTVSQDGFAVLWTRDGQQITRFGGMEGELVRAWFSPDGAYILTSSAILSPDETLTSSGILQLWSSNGRLVKTYRGEDGRFSPDGRLIVASTGEPKAVAVYELSGRLVAQFGGHDGGARGALFLPNGRDVASYSDDGSVRIWSIAPVAVGSCHGHDGLIEQAAVSPDGRFVATISHDMTARIWTWDCKPVGTLIGHTGHGYQIAFSPDGTRILTGGEDGARLWTARGEAVAKLDHDYRIGALAFSPDGQRIVTTSLSVLRFWDGDGKLIRMIDLKVGQFLEIVFAPDGQSLAITSTGGPALRYTPDGRLLGILQGHEKWLSSLRFSPDGSKIVTASQDNTARLWTSDGKPLVTFSGHADWVSDAIFHPDGQHVQTWSKDGTTRVWTLDGREVATRPAPGGDTDRAHLTRDGRRIVLRSRDSAPTVWSIEGELLATLGTHHSYTVAVSHDGTKVFASGNGGDASVYSIFPDTASLVSGVQPRIGRCFGIDKRRELLIAAAPPSWCPAGPDRKTREREAQQLSSAASQLAVQNLIRQAKAKLDNKQAWEKLEDVVINGADQGRLEEALKEVQEALVVAPSSPIYLDTRAHILLALGRSDEAEADFNRVLAAGLDAAATFWGVGRIADVRGDAARAIKYYEKATTEASGSFNDPFQDYARRMSRDGLVRLRAAASKSP